ncbi:condensation domain-containing protein, partial [Gorillibacterium massiliense]|uniref:condensation domain-containing protein n=1 Tax=Gorillibacterium massiliense TaxID=1280390 RepID=UPI0005925F98
LPPQTETQCAIAVIWQEILRIPHVSLHDNFFDLGGHSLLLMQVFNAIHKEWPVDFQMKDLFVYQTLEELAAHIDTLFGRSRSSRKTRIQPSLNRSEYLLSHAQERLWFLHHLDPASRVYQVPLSFELRGDLQTEALEKAIRYLVMRHESLRTVFYESDGVAYQRIQAWSDVPFV